MVWRSEMKKKIPTRRIKFKISTSNGDICKVLTESLPGCETCPSCGHETLPKIKLESLATGRMCSRCKVVVDRLGNVENGNS